MATVASGCATGLRLGSSTDPLAILQSGSLAYVRADAQAAKQLVSALRLPARTPYSAQAAKRLNQVLDRTRVLALGLGGSGAPELQACLLGDYPFRAAALSLGLDPAWKREKAGYFNAALGLRAALPGPNVVLATSGSLEPLLAAAREPGISPLPSGLSGLASRPLVLWLPFPALASAVLGEDESLPLLGLLIAAERDKDASGGYVASIVFLARDADSARAFRPLLRLAWYGIESYLEDQAEGERAGQPSFVLDGAMFRADGVRLSSAQIEGALSKLSASIGPPSRP
jgi:hypothetical protein